MVGTWQSKKEVLWKCLNGADFWVLRLECSGDCRTLEFSEFCACNGVDESGGRRNLPTNDAISHELDEPEAGHWAKMAAL